ncbi:twitching motility protein PilT [Spirochaetia bacterium]|nr:twitching motility protein PilT [Spirochaetia bacterium]
MNDNILERAFIDTCVCVYLYSDDEPAKKIISENAVNNYDCVISTQVLNEFSAVCIRKKKATLDEIKEALSEMINQFTVLQLEKEDMSKAIDIHDRYQYNYYDCLMIVSALKSDCKYFISEDMNDGQIIENKLTIKVIYPKTVKPNKKI